MICNGANLLIAQPLSSMIPYKRPGPGGVSKGLSEAGYDLSIAQSMWLFPGRRFRLASTVERFKMPHDLVAIIHDKSTWARRGLSVQNTVAEPGWEGWLTLELVYYGWWPLFVPAGAGIAQAIFHRLECPADYGNGKYQMQDNRPVAARETLT